MTAINQVADGRAKGDESRFTATALLFDGSRSVADRSKRTETVRPQLNERCEKRQECDSVLGATNDENDVDLNGETDDDDSDD